MEFTTIQKCIILKGLCSLKIDTKSEEHIILNLIKQISGELSESIIDKGIR